MNTPAPRAHLDGVSLPEGFPLPDLELVRRNARDVQDYIDRPLSPVMGANQRGESLGMMPEPLVYNTLLPHLFKFSYFVRVEDVPHNILKECIWALEMFRRVLLEASDLQLRRIGHILPHQQGKMGEMAHFLMLTNTRFKLTHHLLAPEINRPEDAARHCRDAIEAEATRSKSMNVVVHEPWNANPGLHLMYGISLARARLDDVEAKTTLKRVIHNPTVVSNREYAVSVKIYLSRVLRRLGENNEAQELEAGVIKWFKKNPHVLADYVLWRYFAADIDVGTTDPVLESLGGPRWLAQRKHTSKTDQRLARFCRACGKREPAVKLSQCSRCKHIYYCSRECQRQNWANHKETCKELAAALNKIEATKATDPEKAAALADWQRWRIEPHDANGQLLVHALGLHRAPARGRTHIVFKQVAHVPGARHLRDRFRVAACAVFRIADVLPEIEALLRIDKGEGREYVDGLLKEIDDNEASRGRVPIIDIAFGEGADPWLGSNAMSLDGLRMYPYNPDWRKSMNRDGPPDVLVLKRPDIQEVEHVFD